MMIYSAITFCAALISCVPAVYADTQAPENAAVKSALLANAPASDDAARAHPRDLSTRQLNFKLIPSLCKSRCESTLAIYGACTGTSATAAATPMCLSACNQAVFDSYTVCLQCTVNYTPGGYTEAQLASLQTSVTVLQTACAGQGLNVAAPALTRNATMATQAASRVASASAVRAASLTAALASSTGTPNGASDSSPDSDNPLGSVAPGAASILKSASSRQAHPSRLFIVAILSVTLAFAWTSA